jgi:aminobenzoyl-glutamate utilization protein B
MAQAATMMTDTSVTQRLVGSAWPAHFNKIIAEVQQKNIEAVGIPEWSDADQPWPARYRRKSERKKMV